MEFNSGFKGLKYQTNPRKSFPRVKDTKKLSVFMVAGLHFFKIMDDHCELIASTGTEIYRR